MVRKILYFLSLCGIILAIVLSHQAESVAQVIDQQKVKDMLRATITIFGVEKNTGYVLSFIKVNNDTTARYFDSGKEDKDHDGIIDVYLSFQNSTVSTGTNYTACNVTLKDLTMACKSGIQVQGRVNLIQFLLPTFKQSQKSSQIK